MKYKNLVAYGCSNRFFQEASLYTDKVLGRVISQSHEVYRVMTEDGAVWARVSGKYEYSAQQVEDFPAVGDFVLLDRSTDTNGTAVISHTLTRKSIFKRKAAGTSGQMQVIAANIDYLFLCMAMNLDFNINRLERYLSAAWDSGATPVIVLTKADLCENVEDIVNQTENAAPGVTVLVTSIFDDTIEASLTPYLQEGTTISLVGSSGVGKSSLMNCLLGQEILKTSQVRNDDKGRHTTTHRELILLPKGGVMIDTPGMRELGIVSADFTNSFGDVEELMLQCRFSNCSHTSEPGCAVLEALKNGSLTQKRLDHYQKLKTEVEYNGLTFRQIENKKINRMFGNKNKMKQLRQQVKGRKY